ncbi:hypothetical protein QFC20_006379 [Naganishia adeliensis]|uniref:Uncharacterized protein n=1 Tax=Naganishia adeliensis TaxID=92952 RepID=A0ACC2VDI2_9TREE|nr:hypothetical protein QFC20_006379 [Naganishia adeliensis]
MSIQNLQTQELTTRSPSAGAEGASARTIESATTRESSIGRSRMGTEGSPVDNPQGHPKWKVWPGSPSNRLPKFEELFGAALAREKGVSKNIVYHEISKAKQKKAKFILLKLHSIGRVDDVKYTAELATGLEGATGYHECSIPIGRSKKIRSKRKSISLAPGATASKARLPTDSKETMSLADVDSTAVSEGKNVQPKDRTYADLHTEAQQGNGMTKRFYSWADKWIVTVPGRGAVDETLSSVELSSRTDVPVGRIQCYKRTARTGKHFSEVELSFYANGNKADVRLRARIDLAVGGPNRCHRVLIPLGEQVNSKTSSSFAETGSIATNSTSHLSNAAGSSSLASPSSISVDATVDSQVNEFADLFAEADRTDKTRNGLQGGSRLWPECFSVRRADLALGTDVAKHTVSQMIIGFEAMWESLSVNEQGAFGKMGKQSLRTVLGAGATDASVRHIGQMIVTIDRLSCCQFVSKGKEEGLKPEHIIGQLKTLSEESKMGVGSWICYRYGVFGREGTDLGGFAIGTGSLFRSTGVHPQLIQKELFRDSTEGVFMNPQQVQWRIRRVGWPDQGSVPEGEV